jgi:DNA repair protein RecN (Recombination protein N)
MLHHLSIHNVVLIDKLDLDVSKGLTALTGETGAGKSIVLDALGLALGEKSNFSLIRHGQDQAIVVASFDMSGYADHHPLMVLLRENTLDHDGDILLKRVLTSSQKSKAFINDTPVSVSLLKTVGRYVLDIHGQHDDLLDEPCHKTIIDTYAHLNDDTFNAVHSQVSDAYHAYKAAVDARDHLLSLHKERSEKRFFYDAVLKELKPLHFKPLEENELTTERERVYALGKVIHVVDDIVKGFDFPSDLVGRLYQFQKSIEKVNHSGIPALDRAFAGLERARLDLLDVRDELKHIYEGEKIAAQRLDTIDERLHLMRTMMRKYQTDYVGLLELVQAAESVQHHDDVYALQLNDCAHAIEQAEAVYRKAADQLLGARTHAARALEKAVHLELPDLKLDKAHFHVKVESGVAPKADGHHTVSFYVAMNQGQPLGPLSKTASGGELSRLMLALKVVLRAHDHHKTLIFDEIDTGVGGAVATAIGKRLRLLSVDGQVLSITHSPQVAACAHQHWYIQKNQDTGNTRTTVVCLDTHEERTHEIARMLSGETLSDSARDLARQLMISAEPDYKEPLI